MQTRDVTCFMSQYERLQSDLLVLMRSESAGTKHTAISMTHVLFPNAGRHDVSSLKIGVQRALYCLRDRGLADHNADRPPRWWSTVPDTEPAPVLRIHDN